MLLPGVMTGVRVLLPGTVVSPGERTALPGTDCTPLGLIALPLPGPPAAGAPAALISVCDSLPSPSLSRSPNRPTKPWAFAASSREMKPSPFVSTALKDLPVRGSDNGPLGAMLLGGVVDGEGDEGVAPCACTLSGSAQAAANAMLLMNRVLMSGSSCMVELSDLLHRLCGQGCRN